MQADRKRKYWGWGHSDVVIPNTRRDKTIEMLSFGLGVKADEPIDPMPIENLSLSTPRFDLTSDLTSICTSEIYARANHTYGKAYRDVWRAIRGDFRHAPDYVAFPSTEEDIKKLYAFAGPRKIALIPYGGGSSVVGGIEPRMSDKYIGSISVDMQNFNQLLDIDRASRCARIQAGNYGPAMEAALKEHNYTLRHYPQSFEFSTLGGWIATHAGGHFATMYTHIDDFVQSVRLVSPNGTIATRRLPGSGSGPDDKHHILGSEGIYGIITEAWMRLQDLPKHKFSSTISFPSWAAGVEACRLLSQSGLFPSNARLISAFEATFNNLGKGRDTLILGFESHDIEISQRVEKAQMICKSLGGTWEDNESPKRSKDADEWKKSFLQAPYLRDELVRYGFIVETFESCTSWSNFENFHQQLEQTFNDCMKTVGAKGMMTCRFTHIYPDGPAPYYTIIAKGSKNELEQWDYIKKSISEKLVELGGTITHHHAVGRDHRPYYQQQTTPLFQKVLQSTKSVLDPDGIMNPGVLIEEV